ncbi:MAG: hypothetical protein ACRCXC_00440 [Legionella sp.]
MIRDAPLNGKEPKNLYFIYNNPDAKLKPFSRSNEVIQNPDIIKINLTTGPQAITCSTRMQATTSELFLMVILLEDALYHVLKPSLSDDELKELGFDEAMTLQKRLLSFAAIQKAIYNAAPQISRWTAMEAQTYASSHQTVYFAKNALLQVFTDVTERAPTFSLSTLDTIQAPKKMSWVHVWTPAENKQMAWLALLYRPFSGLDPLFFETPFKQEIADPYLQETALRSLKNAGNEQQNLYDFSFSASNIKKAQLQTGDLGVLILLPGEQVNDLIFSQWIDLFTKIKSPIVCVLLTDNKLSPQQTLALTKGRAHLDMVNIVLPDQGPLGLNQQIGLKMVLNAHSTAVMTKLGLVVGNTMTYVHPSNLKMIGRATYLIEMHVKEALKSDYWLKHYGKRTPLTYAEINAILFDGIQYANSKNERVSEVALSIILILETLKYNRAISWDEAVALFKKQTLASYLQCFTEHRGQVF